MHILLSAFACSPTEGSESRAGWRVALELAKHHEVVVVTDEYRRAAAELVKQGADGVYLFNFFTSHEEGANAYEPPFEVLRELGASPASK